MPAPIPINVILARSPYQVIIDEPNQVSTKVELRLWNKGETRPTTPTYIMSEGIASVTQTETNYNISPFILEYIDKYYPLYNLATVVTAGNKEWCIGEYTTYFSTNSETFDKLEEIEFCAVNGYSTVYDKMNYEVAGTRQYLLLADPNIKVYWNTNVPFYNFIVRHKDVKYYAQWYDRSDSLLKEQNFYSGDDAYFNFSIPLVYGDSVYVLINSEYSENIYKIYTEEICEPIYPIQITLFVNKYGGWNQFAFFKASYNSIDVKNSDYSLMQKNVDYDPIRGQTKPFNINGTQTIKVNTGWLTEDYFELIQDIMLSDTILNENFESDFTKAKSYKPLTIKTTSMQKKTYLKDKNINYTLEFDFANKLINNIV